MTRYHAPQTVEAGFSTSAYLNAAANLTCNMASFDDGALDGPIEMQSANRAQSLRPLEDCCRSFHLAVGAHLLGHAWRLRACLAHSKGPNSFKTLVLWRNTLLTPCLLWPTAGFAELSASAPRLLCDLETFGCWACFVLLVLRVFSMLQGRLKQSVASF